MTAQTLTAQTLATLQAALIADPATLDVSRDSRSGSEWADLLQRMHAADARCNLCNLPTIRTAARVPNAARLVTLVPCVLTDDNGGRDRLGYVPGNLALMCKACTDDSNAYGIATGEPVVFTADSLQDGGARVWLAWPALGKRARHNGEHAEAARLARQALGWPF
jgi:hypothetical protein